MDCIAAFRSKINNRPRGSRWCGARSILFSVAGWADDPWHSPESRQLACAMAESMWAVAAETRANRPTIDLERLRAATAGLGSRRWRDPWRHASLLDADGGVERERPLDDLE